MRRTVTLLCAALAIAAVGCGGDDGSADGTPTETAVGPSASVTAGASPQAAEPPVDVAVLGTLTLTDEDVPAGFAIRSNLPLTRGDVATALRTVPTVSTFVQSSALDGGWASFYATDSPPAALTGIVLRFKTPEEAQKFVELLANLTTRDYPGAKAVDRAPSDKIEDGAQLMRYTLPGSRTLEYTWAQGRLVGQVVLRYSGEVEGPDDPALMVVLARKQADRMRTFAQ